MAKGPAPQSRSLAPHSVVANLSPQNQDDGAKRVDPPCPESEPGHGQEHGNTDEHQDDSQEVTGVLIRLSVLGEGVRAVPVNVASHGAWQCGDGGIMV